jgi:hypothetical protein
MHKLGSPVLGLVACMLFGLIAPPIAAAEDILDQFDQPGWVSVAPETLAEERGGAGLVVSTTTLGQTAAWNLGGGGNGDGGTINFGSGTFADGTINSNIINSGNNVAIQSSMTVNIYIQ